MRTPARVRALAWRDGAHLGCRPVSLRRILAPMADVLLPPGFICEVKGTHLAKGDWGHGRSCPRLPRVAGEVFGESGVSGYVFYEIRVNAGVKMPRRPA
jgi:hypothetical protein